MSSKKEIIITQAGNSGGQTNDAKANGQQAYNIDEIFCRGVMHHSVCLLLLCKKKIGAK